MIHWGRMNERKFEKIDLSESPTSPIKITNYGHNPTNDENYFKRLVWLNDTSIQRLNWSTHVTVTTCVLLQCWLSDKTFRSLSFTDLAPQRKFQWNQCSLPPCSVCYASHMTPVLLETITRGALWTLRYAGAPLRTGVELELVYRSKRWKRLKAAQSSNRAKEKAWFTILTHFDPCMRHDSAGSALTVWWAISQWYMCSCCYFPSAMGSGVNRLLRRISRTVVPVRVTDRGLTMFRGVRAPISQKPMISIGIAMPVAISERTIRLRWSGRLRLPLVFSRDVSFTSAIFPNTHAVTRGLSHREASTTETTE